MATATGWKATIDDTTIIKSKISKIILETKSLWKKLAEVLFVMAKMIF